MQDYSKYIYSDGTHYISNSGGDERGKITGGTAGDQTGKEWQLRGWYNRPWNYVLRFPNKQVALEIANLGCAAALNNKVGYDQNQRSTYWTQLKSCGYDPSKITTACEADCSAGANSNVKAVGYRLGIEKLKNVSSANSSRNTRSGLKAAGFKVLPEKKYLSGFSYLLPGDILLYENHHVATNITMGRNAKWGEDEVKVGTPAEPTNAKEIQGMKVTISGGSVNIRKGPSTEFDAVDVAKNGQQFEVVEIGSDFVPIKYKGEVRWVSAKYAKKG